MSAAAQAASSSNGGVGLAMVGHATTPKFANSFRNELNGLKLKMTFMLSGYNLDSGQTYERWVTLEPRAHPLALIISKSEKTLRAVAKGSAPPDEASVSVGGDWG